MTTRPQTRPPIDRRVVAVPHRVRARQAFLGAMMMYTKAIEDLYAQRVPLACTSSSTVDHLPLLVPRADQTRGKTAREWAARWNLGSPWIESWATYALTRWDISAACRDSFCPFGCVAICWEDDVRAFEVALFTGELALTPELADYPDRSSLLFGFDRPANMVVSNPLIMEPSPLTETLEEWQARTADLYRAKAHAIAALGIVEPRELERHSAWLVRRAVLKQTVAAIADAEHVDVSAVHKAIKQLADLLDFPLR